ncbi:hypothetical protein ANN_27822 [Periplaneta americana]|uniref:Uncharacterized protein n=1 Tax=Periplaneta americana TaxID=6978 RepID=A0ABQ8RVD6_PERAM|nr:hypothetical protein ANN_27822 [Periplaneta americana]
MEKSATATDSAQRCHLCGATSKTFNNIDDMLARKVDASGIKFGLSTLHAWIRLFECLLHLSYKLDIKKWQIRTDEERETLNRNKIRIRQGFKEKLALDVDSPKQGYGSSNDGNTARRFFENSAVSSEITGVDEEIITRFRVILQTLLSGYAIDVDNFQVYTLETARKYVNRYPWYYMPTTVHKILIHSPHIISSALLPIGQLSEDAQEARNKDIRKYREGFSRKSSRENTMQDVFNHLLVSSDPYITSLRNLPRKKLKHLSADVISLLSPPDASTHLDVSTQAPDEDDSADSDACE